MPDLPSGSTDVAGGYAANRAATNDFAAARQADRQGDAHQGGAVRPAPTTPCAAPPTAPAVVVMGLLTASTGGCSVVRVAAARPRRLHGRAALAVSRWRLPARGHLWARIPRRRARDPCAGPALGCLAKPGTEPVRGVALSEVGTARPSAAGAGRVVRPPASRPRWVAGWVAGPAHGPTAHVKGSPRRDACPEIRRGPVGRDRGGPAGRRRRCLPPTPATRAGGTRRRPGAPRPRHSGRGGAGGRLPRRPRARHRARPGRSCRGAAPATAERDGIATRPRAGTANPSYP